MHGRLLFPTTKGGPMPVYVSFLDARVVSMVNTLQRGTVSYEVFKALPVDQFFSLVEQA